MSRFTLLAARGGGIGSFVGLFIKWIIFDICVTTISEVLGVPRLAALFIFLGILVAISIGGYFLKQRVAPGVDD